MNIPSDPNRKKHIQEQLEMGRRVDTLLEHALEENAEREAPINDPHSWHRILLNLSLLAGYVLLGFGVFTWDLNSIFGLTNNPGSQLIVRIIGIIVLTIIYIRMRTNLHETLFPRVDREVVRTIYKIAPELIKDGYTQEAADINLNKNALRTWVMVFGFALLLVAGAIATPDFINTAISITSENSIGGLVIRVILIAFLFGIWSTIRLLLQVHKEYDHLGEMVWRIQHLGKSIHGAAVLKKAIPQEKDSIIGEKLQAIIRIWNIKGHISTSDLQDHSFTHFRLGRQIPHFIAASMPILGLIGTILGLTVSIGGFEEVLSADITDRANFTSSIGVSVSGISTAFYTTLAGTITMLILKVFTMLSGNVYSNFLVDMRNVLAVEVLPRIQKMRGGDFVNDEEA